MLLLRGDPRVVSLNFKWTRMNELPHGTVRTDSLSH